MKRNASFFIAVRYLLGRAREGVRYLRGAATGIAVSLIPIIVTMIVSDGMIRGIMDRYMEFGSGHLQVFEFYGYTENGLEEIIGKVSEVKGVRGVWHEQRGMGVLAGKSGKAGVTVRSIDGSFWDDPAGASFLKIISGGHKPETDRDMVLGETLAQNIGANVGDTVRLMTIRSTEDGRMTPRNTPFTVRGILSCGYNELDALWCIINGEGGDRVLFSEKSSSLIVKVNDPYKKADIYAWDIFDAIGSGFDVYTWKRLLRSQYRAYETTRQILLFIMALIVLVAAVNVSSATSMLALERQRDIAVLKVTGASVRGVTNVFLWGSFLTGLTGSVAGISIGLLIGVNINVLIRSLEKMLSFISGLFDGEEVKILDPGFYLETIPIIVDIKAVFLIGFFTILCSVLASWIPAVRAGKLKPMELLRKT